MHLDATTVVVFQSLVNLMLAAVMAYAWRVSSRIKGTGLWAIGFGCACSGQILLALSSLFGIHGTIVAAFLLQAFGAESLVRGCGLFLGKPVDKRTSTIVVLSALFLAAAAGFVEQILEPPMELHRIVGHAALAAILFRSTLLFFRNALPKQKSVGYGTGIAFAILSFLELYAAVKAFLPKKIIPDSRSGLMFSLFSFVYTGLALTLLQLGYTRFREELEARAHENELLLREMHHRTKNNLALVASMISLESQETNDPVAREVFSRLEKRISTIALLHYQLQNTGKTSSVRADEYLGRVADSVSEWDEGNTKRISIEKEFEPLWLESAAAIPLGLILNELITNAQKHAFPGTRKGHIRTSLRHDEKQQIELIVNDDGIGMTGAPRKDSFGYSLILSLASQLKGDFRYERGPGTRAVLSFPSPPQAAHA